MSQLLLVANLVLIGGLAFGVWAWWRWLDVARDARFRLDSITAAAPPGPWVRLTQRLFVGLAIVEMVFAFSDLTRYSGPVLGIVSAPAVTRMLVALLFLMFLLVLPARSGPLSGGALLREDAVYMGWGIGIRYPDIEVFSFREGDALFVRAKGSGFYFSVRPSDRESIARFLGEKTGKVLSLPAALA